MDLEDQVITQKQAYLLQDLGVDNNSLFYHCGEKWGVMPRKSCDFKNGNPASAFTVGELMRMLGMYAFSNSKEGEFQMGYALDSKSFPDKVGEEYWIQKSVAEGLGDMLLWMIQTKQLSIYDCNKRLKICEYKTNQITGEKIYNK